MSRNQFLSLYLCATRITPQYQMLVIHPTFYLFPYILPRDPQERLWSNDLLNRTIFCELVSDYISSYPGMLRVPVQPHSVPGRDIIQCFLALSYQRRYCFSSLKRFQSRLAIRTNTNIFLWPILNFSFLNAGFFF